MTWVPNSTGGGGRAVPEVTVVGNDGSVGGSYKTADGQAIAISTTLRSLFSDDFGGGAVDTTKCDVILGGLPAVVAGTPYTALQSAPVPTFSQAAIGSGISTGIVGPSVATSVLTIGMGTTANAEVLMLSRMQFAGKEDILAVLSKSQALAAGARKASPAAKARNPNLKRVKG